MLVLTFNKNSLPSPLLLLGSGADGLFGSKFTQKVPFEVPVPFPVDTIDREAFLDLQDILPRPGLTPTDEMI